MTEFTPIPGVWYRDSDGREWVYLPTAPGHESESYVWWYRCGMSLETDNDPEGELHEVHNPHGETRTEWGIQEIGRAGPELDTFVYYPTTEHAARRRGQGYLDGYLGAEDQAEGSTWSAVYRHVTETEWTEVTP